MTAEPPFVWTQERHDRLMEAVANGIPVTGAHKLVGCTAQEAVAYFERCREQLGKRGQ